VDAEKCAALFEHWIDIKGVDTAFICGPEPMMLGIAAALKDHGLAEDQIKFELFASGQPGRVTRPQSSANTVTDAMSQTQATFTLDGATHKIEMSKNTTILEAALENALDAPFACKAGVCSTCKCKVLEGEVEMIANHALEDYEVKNGYILSCQSFPLSDKIVVNYDQH
jgi:ring-1,2-phenylacetyl-CoA epoxidase subunit PaaE